MAALTALLRTHTAGLHDRLERLPFFQLLRSGHLTKPPIVSYLRSLTIIHGIIERELFHTADRQVAELGKHTLPKVPRLLADLEALGAERLPVVMPAIRGALEYAAEILANANDPWSLVGVLYVLEGSQKGGLSLKRAYVKCLRVPKEQLSYFGCYGRDTAAHWKSFGRALDSLDADSEQTKRVVESAVNCFERLEKICGALHPCADNDLQHHVTAVNFEAGNHAMPPDLPGIDLALRAGMAAWRKYPYLEHRFGSRGRRFTCSDSCWLVALTRVPVETATKSLEWLRTVLASRGIPTVILEGHLQAIVEMLAQESAGQDELPSPFARFLSNLDDERRALAGSAGRLKRLTDRFDQRLCGCTGRTVDSAAELIASAWIDERSGITGALTAVLDWFTDADRFSNDWIVNVREFAAELDKAGELSC
jgi:heme oxygenase